MSRDPRKLWPWELKQTCAKCGAKPGDRCVTVRTHWRLNGNDAIPGVPTTAHRVRVDDYLNTISRS